MQRSVLLINTSFLNLLSILISFFQLISQIGSKGCPATRWSDVASSSRSQKRGVSFYLFFWSEYTPSSDKIMKASVNEVKN